MTPLARRHILAAAAAAPLAACTPGEGRSPGPRESSVNATTSPSGSTAIGTIRAVIFDGAFGTDYVKKAGEVLAAQDPSASVAITPTTNIASVVEPLTDTSTPDLIDNSGPNQLPMAAWTDRLTDLAPLLDSPNLEGTTIRDTLYDGVLTPGTHDGRLLALSYALSVYGLWYSSSRFAADGLEAPQAWDELIELGSSALEAGIHLFAWSPDAANYYQELAIASAIKEGGHEVRRQLDNLDPGCWSHPAVTAVLGWLAQCVKAGLFLRHETFLDAQTAWVQGESLLHPSGAWIAKEMASAAPDTFEMAVAPAPTVTAAPTLPIAAVHATSTEQFVIPAAAKNARGATQVLRAMLSQEVTRWFATQNLVPTVVRSTVPTDLDHPALSSQTRLLADAGDHVFSWRFDTYYGLVPEHNLLWSAFLSGELDADALASELQELTDRAANDSTLEHYTVE